MWRAGGAWRDADWESDWWGEGKMMAFRACERRRAVEINVFSCFFALAHGVRAGGCWLAGEAEPPGTMAESETASGVRYAFSLQR